MIQPVAILAQISGILSPALILVLCVVAGIGTVLLLPSRKENSVRKIGGAILFSALVILGLIIGRAIGATDILTAAYFWIFSGIAILGAVRVVTHPRPVYSALYFVLTVFATAGLFVLMYAEFMAAALVLIYAGAILVTYVFVIMLASSAQSGDARTALAGVAEYDLVSREPWMASCIGFALMGVLLFLIFDKAAPPPPVPAVPAVQSSPAVSSSSALPNLDDETVQGSTQAVGVYLFENQLVNLELAGLILTVSMVGAIMIARRRVPTAADAFEPTAETITANMTPINDDPRSIPVYGTTDRRQKAFPQT